VPITAPSYEELSRQLFNNMALAKLDGTGEDVHVLQKPAKAREASKVDILVLQNCIRAQRNIFRIIYLSDCLIF